VRSSGKTLIIVGGAIYIASLALLHYVGEVTFWQAAKADAGRLVSREPVLLTGIAALAIMFALTALFTDAIALPLIAAACSFWLLGQTLYGGESTYSFYGSGYWVCAGAAVVMCLGGLLALADYSLDPAERSAYSQPTQTGRPPAGWYADPADPAQLRYWSGTAWTEQTSG
jgi:hypothetical protein